MKPFARGLPICLIALFAIGFLAPVLFTNQVLLPGEFLQRLHPFSNMHPSESHANWNALQWDALAQYYPWRLFAQRSLQQGEIPLWNPHSFCGAPFAANGQSAVYYPLNLLFWVLPTAVAFGWSAALHLFLAGAFMFGLGRTLKLSTTASLLSAVSFTFCGFLVTWLELPTLMNVAVWIPLVFLLIEKILQKPTATCVSFLALAIGAQFLAGHFQISLYLMLAVAFRWLWAIGAMVAQQWESHAEPSEPCVHSRAFVPIIAIAIAVALGCGLAGCQILPTAEFAHYNHRASHPTLEAYRWYVAHAMPWEHIGTLFLPDLFGNPTRSLYWGPGIATGGAGSYTEMCGYVGLLPLILALMSFGALRRSGSGFYGALLVFSLLVALGTPVAYPLYFCVPGFSQVGGFSRILVLFCFSASLLAGVGWESGVRSDQVSVKKSLLPMAIIAALGWLLVHFAMEAYRNKLPAAFAAMPSEPPLNFSMLLLGLWFILALASRYGKISSGLFGSLSLALVAGDLLVFAVGFNPTASRNSIYPPFQWSQAGEIRPRSLSISDKWSLYRFPDATLPPNGMVVYGGYDVQGYDSLQSQQYKALAARLEGGNPTPLENGNMLLFHNISSPWMNLLGVRYVLASHPLASKGLRLLSEQPVYLYENPSAYPAAFTMTHLPSIYEVERGFQSNGSFGFGAARVEAYSALAVSIRPPSRGSYVMLTDSFFPGWRVFVDGRESAPIVWAGALRAVALPASGARTVVWLFLPFSVKFGTFVSLVSFASMVAAWSNGWVRGRISSRRN